MSAGGQHLKDEVRLLVSAVDHHRTDHDAQGSQLQVFVAGGVAGLVSRYFGPWNPHRPN